MTRFFPHAIFPTVLVLLALWIPLPLYLLALALFGLPHVIWEMGFIRSRYAARWPQSWWYAVWAVLLIQAGVRTAVWLGSYPASSSLIVDLLTLALLLVIVLLTPFRTGWVARAGVLFLASLLMWSLEFGDVLTVLLILALAHNFTPLAMSWDMARDDLKFRPLAWRISALFMLPVLVAVGGWTSAALPSSILIYAPLLDGQLPSTWGGAHREALLSAIVLAQCLHYYCVIYLLPGAEKIRVGKTVLTPRIKNVALVVIVLMLTYYAIDYIAARKLYAVAAGVHAWLEWPVILMAFVFAIKNNEVGSAAKISTDGTKSNSSKLQRNTS